MGNAVDVGTHEDFAVADKALRSEKRLVSP
jgi:hypothetical protein